MTPPPESSPSQRARMSLAEVSAIRLAISQPMTGATIIARRYSARRPSTGSLIRKIRATMPMTGSRAMPRALRALSLVEPRPSRRRNARTHRSSPGRKRKPKRTVTRVSLVSRALRRRVADRQCSTTVCGSVPKDWMRALRAPPSIRSWTAREKASPRLGVKYLLLKSLDRPSSILDLCHSLSALRMSATGLSRYAAEARAFVATACPAAPWSGICAPGEKSNPSLATVAPTCRQGTAPAAVSQLPCPAHLLSWDHSVSSGAEPRPTLWTRAGGAAD